MKMKHLLVILVLGVPLAGCAGADQQKVDEPPPIVVDDGEPAAVSENPDEITPEEAPEGPGGVEIQPLGETPIPGAQPAAVPVGTGTSNIGEAVEAVRNLDWSTAVIRYEDILRSKRSDPDALKGLVRVLLRLGKFNDAMNRANELIAVNSSDLESLTLLMAVFAARNEYRAGVDEMQKLVDKEPDDLAKQNVLLKLMVGAGDQRRAIERSRELLRKDEVNVELMKTMASAYLSLGKFRTAEYILKRASELRKIDADIAYMVAHIRRNTAKNKADMVNAFRTVLELRPDMAEAHNNLGLVYYETRNYQNAADEFTAAVRLAPGLISARLNLGNAQKALREYILARDTFLAIVKDQPDYVDAYYNLGILYFENEFGEEPKEKLLARSIEYFEKYRSVMGPRLNPQDPVNKYIPEARDLIAQIEKGKLEEKELRQAKQEKFQRLEKGAFDKIESLNKLKIQLEERANAWEAAGDAEKAQTYKDLVSEFGDLYQGSMNALQDAMNLKDGDEVEAIMGDLTFSDEDYLPRAKEALDENPPGGAGPEVPGPGETPAPEGGPVEPTEPGPAGPEAGPEPIVTPEPVATPQPDVEVVPAPVAEPEPVAAPEPEPMVVPETAPTREPEPVAGPEPVASPEVEHGPTPVSPDVEPVSPDIEPVEPDIEPVTPEIEPE